MTFRATALQQILLGSVAVVGVGLSASPAIARDNIVKYNIPAQGVEKALRDFGLQNGMTVMADAAIVRGKRTAGLTGQSDPDTALRTLLKGTGLTFQRDGSVFVIKPVGNENIPAVEHVQAPSDLEIVVTAQKKEEKIIDVPIAMTALSADALDDRKIEGGSELLRAIPNVNFSKSNFSMYNFSIRGIGTKAVSASSDPAVAVNFNNTPLVRNRLFEAEFFDMERIEVLRGPQGTLYGRNATAGVVNLIPALPGPQFGGEFKGEVGNYSTTRLSGMLNVPVGNTLGVRVAGAWTKRDGFDYNTFTQNRVNGRDLWSTRATLAWEPSDRFRVNMIWQHFEEDDDRARTGKQLCTRDPGPEKVGSVSVTSPVMRGRLSQGCLAGSLYDDAAYGAPNGRSLVYLYLPQNISMGFLPNPGAPGGRGGPRVNVVKDIDPFGDVVQSKNLREISTSYDPKFKAKNDIFQLNLNYEFDNGISFFSQTAYSRDRYNSSQDYNRFVSEPMFNDTAQALVTVLGRPIDTVRYPGPTPGGVYCDGQLGCSDRMLSIDLSRSKSRQWTQEFRVQSDFESNFNFNIGANYLDFKSQDDYFVFNNMFTLIADWFYSRDGTTNALSSCDLGFEGRECPYVDRKPIDQLDGQGHNYFVSQNGVRIKSKGLFGEAYLTLSDNLKLTAGMRYTDDKKLSDQVPSQLLLAGGAKTDSPGDITGGSVNSGYPRLPDIGQRWRKFTGRLVLDWKPEIGFTDDTLLYVSASRGYKGGGVNPPRVDFNPAIVQYQFLPQTFRPEFLNAFEIGTKNSLDGGRLTFNTTAFLYDYKDYQISQIVDRIAYNENFDAINWGLELEAAWRPSRAFRVDANFGFLKTKLKKGSRSIDVMDRTQGNSEFTVLRPWLQVPSNCIAPTVFVEELLRNGASVEALASLCPGATRLGTYDPSVPGRSGWHTQYGFTYNPLNPYNPDTVGLNIDQGGSGAPNGGRGFDAILDGNELPNAPRWTANIGSQYKFFLENGDWEFTIRGDYYVQSKSYARIYNTEFDRLKSWDNFNILFSLDHVLSNFSMQFYVKNVFNKSPITDIFVNSDDTGLTANVFTSDPRIIGFNVSKKF